MKIRLTLACALLALVGCAAEKPSDGASANGAKTYRIAVIPKGTTHEFWKSVHAGAEQAAKEFGNVEVIWKGPLQESDREGQISLVQDFVTSRVDGICLAPLDSQGLIAPVRAAKAEGIPTVVFDSALAADEDDIVSYVATDNYHCGAMAAQAMAKMLDGKGRVILLRYSPGSESTEQREQGFLDTLAKESPGIEILSSNQHSGTSFENAFSVSQQLLLKFDKQVDGVFTVCEPNSTGMLRALSEREELAGKVKFIAFDPNSRLIQAMSEGTVHGIVLQDPVKMGYLAVKAMVNHLTGQPTEKRVAIEEFIATPANMSEPEMAKLLTPVQFED